MEAVDCNLNIKTLKNSKNNVCVTSVENSGIYFFIYLVHKYLFMAMKKSIKNSNDHDPSTYLSGSLVRSSNPMTTIASVSWTRLLSSVIVHLSGHSSICSCCKKDNLFLVEISVVQSKICRGSASLPKSIYSQ